MAAARRQEEEREVPLSLHRGIGVGENNLEVVLYNIGVEYCKQEGA